MATTSTSFGFRIPATYPYNQNFPAVVGNIATDTESQPDLTDALSQNYIQASRAAYAAEKRKVQVQTKVFRTDTNGFDFQSNYTTVNKSLL